MKKIAPKFLILLSFLSSFGAYSQQREIQESLVYSDPTVAKGENWVKGFSIDYNQKKVNGTGYDSSGNALSQNTSSKTIGYSAYLGKGDYTLMFIRAPIRYTTSVSSGGTVNINGSYYSNEFIGRYLLTEYKNQYFVPYVMGGYVSFNDTQDMDIYVGGVREVNRKTGSGPGGGIGGIFPITTKYGFRTDVRYYLTHATSTNNLFSSYNYSRNEKFIRAHVTAYYNINDNLNAQFGVQNTLLTTNNFYLKVGYTF